MAFVDYQNKIFVNVGESTAGGPDGTPAEPITLLDTNVERSVLLVCSLIVCNITALPIRFNLRKEKTIVTKDGSINPVIANVETVTQFPIEPFTTVDIISHFKLNIPLVINNTLTTLTTDKLLAFTNGNEQVCDCEITYTVLEETNVPV